MRRLGTAGILATVLGFCFSVSLCPPVTGQTRVRAEGRTIYITVPLQFVVPAWGIDGELRDWQGGPGELMDPLIFETVSIDRFTKSWDRLMSGATEIWNKAFRKLRYRGCFELRLETGINFIPFMAEGDSDVDPVTKILEFAKPGFHHIWLKDAAFVAGGYFPDGMLDPLGDPTRDIPDPYVRRQFGSMGFLNSYELAHELGHFIGLGDDYVRVLEEGEVVTRPKSGRWGTFMSDDYDSGHIDQALVDRVGDLASQFTELPPCLYARFESRSRAPHGGSGRLDVAEIFLGLGEDGALDGEGTHTISGDTRVEHRTCTDTLSYRGSSTFQAVGRRDGDHVELDCREHVTEMVISDTGCTLGGPVSVRQRAPVPLCVFEADLIDGRFKSEETRGLGAGPANMVTRILIEERGCDALR